MKVKVGKYTLYADSMSMWINETYEIEKGKNAGERKTAGGYIWRRLD